MTVLPGWISAALQHKLEDVSRNDLRQRAQAISDAYRGGGSSDLIRSELDSLAYAVVRMPATYAAVRAALAQTMRIIPDFAPRSLVDIGAGPGTASWAALDAWPSLRRATLIDRNAHLLDLARQLRDSGAAPHADLHVTQADMADIADLADLADMAGMPPDGLKADAVMASYALTELAPAAWRGALAKLWELADRLLLIVEPGTMSGFKRIFDYRNFLLAAGAAIVAPCSHEGPCPLSASARWCHFGARLARSRDHRLTKGADAPYEDEKFTYLVAGKGFGDLERGRRILASPKVSKASVVLTLCAPQTAQEYVVDRRQKDAYKAAKRYDWGDAISDRSF